MKVKMTNPCDNCPFRSDIKPFDLRKGRLKGIIQNLMDDDMQTFPCHKTTGLERDEDGFSESEWQHCAGAMAMLYKLGYQNVAMRLAFAFKYITPQQLRTDLVYDSLEDLLRAYEH